MDEGEWLNCTDPQATLASEGSGTFSTRNARLFRG